VDLAGRKKNPHNNKILNNKDKYRKKRTLNFITQNYHKSCIGKYAFYDFLKA
jgi:hypothetical protein